MGALLKPMQHWVWSDPARRGLRLLRFAEVEADGGRDLVRAAELTADPRLRRLYLAPRDGRAAPRRHVPPAAASSCCTPARGASPSWQPDWLAPGERGLDDVKVEGGRDGPLLAFLHLSEAAAARDFAIYRDAVGSDGRHQGGVRAHPARRGLPHELHAARAGAGRAEEAGPAALGGAAQPAMESLSALRGRGSPG